MPNTSTTTNLPLPRSKLETEGQRPFTTTSESQSTCWWVFLTPPPFVTHQHPPTSLCDSLGGYLPCPTLPPPPTCPSLVPNSRWRGSTHPIITSESQSTRWWFLSIPPLLATHHHPPTSLRDSLGVFLPCPTPPLPTCPSLAPNARQRGSAHLQPPANTTATRRWIKGGGGLKEEEY